MADRDRELIDKVRRGYEAFNRGDFDAAVEMADPDIELVARGGFTNLRGADKLRAWMEPETLENASVEPEHFEVAGMDTGLERFNPEWLFRVPGRIEGKTENVQGEEIFSNALTNVRQAYGLDLELLKDTDRDGFPDVIDPAPFKRGYKDGEN